MDASLDMDTERFYDCKALLSEDDFVYPMPQSSFHAHDHYFQIIKGPVACRLVKQHPKKSLHVKVYIAGRDILALVDTGATFSFVQ